MLVISQSPNAEPAAVQFCRAASAVRRFRPSVDPTKTYRSGMRSPQKAYVPSLNTRTTSKPTKPTISHSLSLASRVGLLASPLRQAVDHQGGGLGSGMYHRLVSLQR